MRVPFVYRFMWRSKLNSLPFALLRSDAVQVQDNTAGQTYATVPHLNIDPIELIETYPGTPLRQASEEFTHHLVVDLIGAVEDYAKDTDRLSEFMKKRGVHGKEREAEERCVRKWEKCEKRGVDHEQGTK